VEFSSASKSIAREGKAGKIDAKRTIKMTGRALNQDMRKITPLFFIGIEAFSFDTVAQPEPFRHCRGGSDPGFDTLLPHPIYQKMYWLCVLSPSKSTYSSMEALLRESYELQSNRTQRRTSGGDAEA
jgi:hypothetical protein